MKTINKVVMLLALVTLSILTTTKQAKAQVGVSAGFQVFYDDLSPYGSWVNNPQYGYVWYPNAGDDFSPYGSNGYWALTDYGWTWVSYYPWGWAPFHYGRWYNDPMYGSMWVPGNEWGPGWVTWRQSEGYYGWAPIGPGISLEIAYSSGYNVRNDDWRFVRNNDFGRTDINNHYVDRSTNVTIINNTTVINNTYVDNKRGGKYNTGPQRADVEKRAGKSFTPVTIKENSKHGESMGKGELNLYRPNVQKNTGAAKKEAPAKVSDTKDLKDRHQQAKEPQKAPGQPANQKAAPAKQQNNKNGQKPEQQKRPVPQGKQEATPPQQKQQNRQQPNQPREQQKNNVTPVKPNSAPQQPRNQPQQQEQRKNASPPIKQERAPQQQRNQPQQQAPPQQREQPHQQAPRNDNKPERQQPPHQQNAQPRQPQPQQQNAQPRPEQQPQPQQPPQQNQQPKLEGEGKHPH